jgi:transposase
VTAASPALFVGIDIAAKTLAAAWLRPGEVVSRPITLTQSLHGFATLHERLGQTGCTPPETHVVMEATGSYWIALATTLVHTGYRVSVINPAQAHHFAKALLKRAKTDAIDAQTLAQLAALLQPALWTPPPTVYYEVQQRLAQRDALRDVQRQLMNQLHALLFAPLVVASVKARMEELIETLGQQIRALDAEVSVALAADAAWAASAARLQSIKGVGLITAAWLLVTTLNFTICSTPEAAVAYAGLAPNPYESGTSVRGRRRIGHTGNGRMRTALYLATLSAAQHNPVIKAFYERMRAAGKPPKVARCAAARKLLHIAWAVVRNEEDFDPAYAQRHIQQPVAA